MRGIQTRRSRLLALVFVGVLVGCGGESETPAPPVLSFEEQLQQQLAAAQPGSVVEIPPGIHAINRSLALTVNGVTLRGAGPNAAVLSFKNQLQGTEGLRVTADGVTLEGFAIEDPVGDALQITNSADVTVRNVRAEWTSGPQTANGSFALAVSQSRNVLIDGAVAVGAADAGVFVDQSQNVVIRNGRFEYNVAGIEIRNATRVDVHDNVLSNNTGGVMVYDLPGLTSKGSGNRVFNNRIQTNNTDNFAPEGTLVATVPTGAGMMIMATDDVEVFGNTIADNDSVNVMVIGFGLTGLPIEDPDYDAFPDRVHIHGNTFTGGGTVPDNPSLQQLQAARNAAIPDIVWDGFLRANAAAGDALCLGNNGDADFANLDAPGGMAAVSTEVTPHACTLPSLPAVSL